jgi:PST family polysaccharide transporter/lipopolysaccharide exporter
MTRQQEKIHKKTIHGAAWQTLTMIMSELLLMLRTLILAAMLGPRNMGLFGMAMLSVTTVDLLSKTGFSQALIQHQGDVTDHLGTAWLTQVGRGVTLTLCLFFTSAWIGNFFNEPTVVPALQILSLVPLINGLQCAGFVNIQRNMDFKKQFIIETAQSVSGLLAAVAYAFYSPTLWAMVFGTLVSVTTMVMTSYVVSKPWIFGPFRWKLFRQLRRFGFWVFVASIVTFALTRGSDFVVGKLLAASALGVYQLAMNISNKPVLKLTSVLNAVTFPAFSIVKSDPIRLKKAFLETFTVVCAAVFLAGLMMFVLSTEFVDITLGDKWEEAAPLVKWLTIWGISRGLGAVNSSFFMAVGKPSLATIFLIWMLVIAGALIYPLVNRYGLSGVGITLAIAGISGQIFRYILLNRILKASFIDVYLPLVLPAVGFVVGIAVYTAMQFPLHHLPPILRFVINGAVGLMIYAAVLAVGSKYKRYLLKQSILKVIDVIRKKKD